MGIPVVYGSDSHHGYEDMRPKTEKYLTAAGFRDGDISELSPEVYFGKTIIMRGS